MELWIRSQDKEKLILTNSIKYVCEDNLEPKHIITSRNETRIYYHKIFINGEVFAIYDSEKRALEVLDEIQYNIKNIGKCELTDDGIKYYTNIYEMPEE